jgi:hypothetical protein
MFLLIVAMKYIFDCTSRTDSGASETLRLSFVAAIIAGLVIGAFYYLNAGHIIGENASPYCATGTVCPFNWQILGLAAKAFLISGTGTLLTIIGFRSIYNELSFMLSKKK